MERWSESGKCEIESVEGLGFFAMRKPGDKKDMRFRQREDMVMKERSSRA